MDGGDGPLPPSSSVPSLTFKYRGKSGVQEAGTLRTLETSTPGRVAKRPPTRGVAKRRPVPARLARMPGDTVLEDPRVIPKGVNLDKHAEDPQTQAPTHADKVGHYLQVRHFHMIAAAAHYLASTTASPQLQLSVARANTVYLAMTPNAWTMLFMPAHEL